jgi:predicted aminopeptidase
VFDKSILTRFLILISLLQLTACSSIAYIAHTGSGHLKLMSDRQPISSLINDEHLTQAQKDKFKKILRIREFASEQLHLPDNKSYTSYVELNRDYVTWIVFAAPALSLQAESWCFWVIGCVPYRGYFNEAKAHQFASQLRQQQLDVYIAPVPAYSTLGWFSDPVLSSMLDRGELATAEYIFHELDHQQLYIKNDTGFNEAFASAVGQLGVIAWLESEKKHTHLTRYLKSRQETQQIYLIVDKLRQQLARIYATSLSEAEQRRLKREALVAYQQTVRSRLKQWEEGESYEQWLLEDMNNAKLNAMSTYSALVPEFISLFKKCHERFDEFYRVVESTQRLNKQQRSEFLHNGKCHPVSKDEFLSGQISRGDGG